MRIALLLSSLELGGAQRVALTLAGGWSRAGHEVWIVTLGGREHDFFPVPAGVQRVALSPAVTPRGPLKGMRANLARIGALRKALRGLKADVAVGFVHQVAVLTVLASRGLRLPAIVAERNNPREYRLSTAWRILRRLTYPRASAVVVQTEGIRRWAARFVPGHRIHVIPNPVETPSGPRVGRKDPRKVAVAMGRLVPQKGFDLLLEAFAKCAPKHPDWDLVIVGEGPERQAIEARRAGLRLASRVRLAGAVQDPWASFGTADLFVLSSRFEGFPNVLLEAMARGLPVISTDCPTGPAEIIRPDANGLLVPPDDAARLADAMDVLMGDAARRARLGEAARQVSQRFSVEGALARWESVFQAVVAKATAAPRAVERAAGGA